jgi:cysteine-S-conjugate beta-lyase
MPKPLQRDTALIHHPYQPPAGFEAPQPGVHKASTVVFPNVAALRARNWKEKTGYTYGLHGTPTTFTLEERIATLEGGTDTLLLPSGLAAIALVDMALLKSGDELLIPENSYGPSKELARHELSRWGVSYRLYDPSDPRHLAETIGPSTRLVWLEAPGSVTMEFPDLVGLLKVAASRGIPCALDNTWGAGVAFNAFDLTRGAQPPVGASIVVQALTKYASGGGDVMMGSVTTRDPELHLRLKATHMRQGWGVGANDAELVLRSLSSLSVRYAAQDASARKLARWFAGRPEIERVLHPALEGSPGHEHWSGIATQAAGLFAVVFDARYDAEQVDRFLDRLQLFKLGYSWAGPVSLAVPYNLAAIRSNPAWRGVVVRFSVGLEASDDLIADLAEALNAVFA